MKYFIDCEFLEKPGTLDLISIGVVAEDGRTFYAENSEFDLGKMTPWLVENVKPYLRWHGKDAEPLVMCGSSEVYDPGLAVYGEPSVIADKLRHFAEPHTKPEFWGWYCAYDWVAFCWLFGTMMDLPDGYPMYCREIQTYYDTFEKSTPEPKGTAHNALDDARYHKELHDNICAHMGHYVDDLANEIAETVVPTIKSDD